MKLRREAAHQLPFEQACEHIYDQSFYPLVTHFTFAFQSSAVARLRFVRRIAAAMAFSEALTNEAEFNALCREVGLSVQSLSSKWHLTFGMIHDTCLRWHSLRREVNLRQILSILCRLRKSVRRRAAELLFHDGPLLHNPGRRCSRWDDARHWLMVGKIV